MKLMVFPLQSLPQRPMLTICNPRSRQWIGSWWGEDYEGQSDSVLTRDTTASHSGERCVKGISSPQSIIGSMSIAGSRSGNGTTADRYDTARVDGRLNAASPVLTRIAD